MANTRPVRVVLDTNILISAALKTGGLEAAVVNAILEGRLELWVTAVVWAEYEEVMGRPKFARVQEECRRILEALRSRARIAAPVTTSAAISDEDDRCFMECAEGAEAEFLVTGNLRHYPPACGTTVVVNSRELFTALEL